MIWRFLASSGYTDFYFPIEEQKKIFEQLYRNYLKESKSVKDIWNPLIMLRREPCKYPDFFDIDNSGIIAISEEALEKSKHFFFGNIELLPIITDAGNYYLINILNIIDCLYKENSAYSLNKVGMITNFNYLNFHMEKLEQVSFFKIPELLYMSLIEHDALVYFQENLFMGLEFDRDVNLL